MSYKLVTFESPQGPRAGIVLGEQVVDAAAATGRPEYATMLGILADWAAADAAFAQLGPSTAGGAIPFDRARLHAPVPLPGALYCAGANYGDHVREMNARQGLPPDPDPHTLGLRPWHFIKSSQSVVGPGTAVAIPPESKALDWEIELAAVIGRTAKRVAEADALGYVAGYTIANDLSARDLMARPPVPKTSPFSSDWLGQKSFDGACPLGPWIVPARDIPDPQRLGLRLTLNGAVMQDSNTSEMLFNLAEQIAQVSLRITLHPGDVILTGTPAGVGAGRGLFLKSGDQLELWIEQIGTLRHSMTA